ncbi:hypothetical protein Q1W73_07080 [Asticcacaulis sp. ZE23SCel15]|uniref:hypothetical protein n=1 Tax=Asticcacaulis sp. ZE23SCel15 TaxID=3059027 RepID=UPI00265E5155|nr:hypothetical protein [Asticcacaulis sp. ZE23SCel15]WKL58742.1 hypothetical protein Q1W73_07080 [Asticcacaulis sp. ZE23SCel15]
MENSVLKKLLTLANQCSPGDLSTFAAILQSGSGSILTSSGSANDALWSECVTQGWATFKSDIIDGVNCKIFSILPEGWDEIEGLFAMIKEYYDPRDYHMSKIYNEICHPFVENFYDAIGKGTGKDEDVEALVALLLTRLVSRRYKPAQFDDKLMFISAHARQILKNR